MERPKIYPHLLSAYQQERFSPVGEIPPGERMEQNAPNKALQAIGAKARLSLNADVRRGNI